MQPLLRTVWRFLKKLNIELPYDSAIPLLGIYLEKTLNKKCKYPHVYCVTIYSDQDIEPKSPSIDEWRKIYGTFSIPAQWNIVDI